jgi:uncharacterized membrane protein/protein-disulfide isomerase
MKRPTAAGVLLFCLLGLVASGSSAYVHYRLLNDPGYTSFCGISETWNCETVYESRFGAFRGVPVAIGGLIWFVGATLLSLVIWRRAGRLAVPPPASTRKERPRPATTFADHAQSYLFVWSIVGLSFVLYLAYASFFVLKTVCVLCLLIYVAVIGIFILAGSGSGSDIPMRSLPGRALRDLRAMLTSPAALAVVLLFAGFAASAIAFFPRQPVGADEGGAAATAAATAPAPLAPSQQSEFERYYTSQPRVPLPVATDGAKVVIVKFNDYLCPPCRQTYLEYKPILAKWRASHPGQVKYVSMDYPLEPECNANAPGGQHLAACEAAVAVRLAREKGRADAMEAWLFDNQPSMTPALVREGVKQVGQVTDFEARYASVLELVKGDVALGAQLGVRGTPTFFVNGVRIPGLKAEYFDAAIAYEMKQAGVK